MVAAIGAFGGVVARTAAQGGVARAAASTTSAARSANIASSVSGAVGNTVSQARSGKSDGNRQKTEGIVTAKLQLFSLPASRVYRSR